MQAWIFSDGAVGNEKQALALASRLELTATQRVRVQLPRVARWLAPQWWRASLSGLMLQSVPLSSNAAERLQSADPAPQTLAADRWLVTMLAERAELGQTSSPTLAIGCGRAGAVALDALKRAAPASLQLRTLQILDPRCDPARFDYLLIPEHDRARGANVITLCGSVHTIDAAWLAEGQLPPLQPTPQILMLIGGPTGNARYSTTHLQQTLEALPFTSVALSLSRRTPDAMRKLAVDFVRERRNQLHSPRLWRGPEDGENPYQQWMSQSAEIWVTPDSVNMLSEAVATGAIVQVLWPETSRGKQKRFIQTLKQRAAAGRFDGCSSAISALRAGLNLPPS